MDVQIDVGRFGGAPADLLERAVRHALAADGRPAEISLALVDDEAITELNRTYLGKDRTTDVIAFSLGQEDAPLGDVYLCVDQARRQAAELAVEPEEELARLAIHGVLHVLGHDHPDGPERAQSAMFALQERLLAEVFATDG